MCRNQVLATGVSKLLKTRREIALFRIWGGQNFENIHFYLVKVHFVISMPSRALKTSLKRCLQGASFSIKINWKQHNWLSLMEN